MVEAAIPACTEDAVAIVPATDCQRAGSPARGLLGADSAASARLTRDSGLRRLTCWHSAPHPQIPVIICGVGGVGFAFAGKLLYYIGLENKKNQALGETRHRPCGERSGIVVLVEAQRAFEGSR